MSIPNGIIYTLAGVCVADSAFRVARTLSPKVYIQAKKYSAVVKAILATSAFGVGALTFSKWGVNSFLPFNRRFINLVGCVIAVELLALLGLSLYSSEKIEDILAGRYEAHFKKEFNEVGQVDRNLMLSDIAEVGPSREDACLGTLKKSFRSPGGISGEKGLVLAQVISLMMLGAFSKISSKLFFVLGVAQLASFIALSNLRYAQTNIEISLALNSDIKIAVGTPLFLSGSNESCSICREEGRYADVKVCRLHTMCTACLKNWMERQAIDKLGKHVYRKFWPFPNGGDKIVEYYRDSSLVLSSYDRKVEVNSNDVPNCPTCRSAELTEITVKGEGQHKNRPLHCNLEVEIKS